jgi:hypothetical protein
VDEIAQLGHPAAPHVGPEYEVLIDELLHGKQRALLFGWGPCLCLETRLFFWVGNDSRLGGVGFALLLPVF